MTLEGHPSLSIGAPELLLALSSLYIALPNSKNYEGIINLRDCLVQVDRHTVFFPVSPEHVTRSTLE